MNSLLPYALLAEQAASAAFHPDNVAPCLFGGLTLATSMSPLRRVRVPVPERILTVLAHPHVRVDTRDARRLLRTNVPLADHIRQRERDDARSAFRLTFGGNILRGNLLTHLAVALLSLRLFAACAGEVNAHGSVSPDFRGGSSYGGRRQKDGVFESFEQAFRAPEKVRRLVIQNENNENSEIKHLPSRLGTLVNLEALEISCLEKLEDLPEELGRLRKLQELIIDNGNGCQMNVTLPRSVGQLESLRVLTLYGALDARDIDSEAPARAAKSKSLPDTIANLQRLEELNLGRNGLGAVPPQVASLRQLKRLLLEYNDIHEIPAFVGDLTNLKELSLNSNGGVVLPPSLANLKGLKVLMGNNKLTLREQRSLRARFPDAVFSFENEYDDASVNEEPAKPKSRTRRRK
jgi:Leucine-rich repeat (LRR) protein